MHYIINYDLCSFFVASITMIFFMVSPRLFRKKDILFSLVGILCIIINPLEIALVSASGSAPDYVIYILNTLYLVTLHSLPFLMMVYISVVTGHFRSSSSLSKVLFSLPYVAEMILLITTPFTGILFTVKSSMYYVTAFSYIVYVFAMFYLAIALITVIISRNRMDNIKKASVYSFIFLVFAAIIVQFLNPAYLLVNFAAALSLTIMYISLQSTSEMCDPLTKTFNMETITALIVRRFKSQKPFKIVVYSLTNFRKIREIYGEEYGDQLLIHLCSILRSTFDGKLSRTNVNKFSMLISGDYSMDDLYAKANTLPQKISFNEREIILTSTVLIVDSTDFNSTSDMHDVIDFGIQKATLLGSGMIICADTKLTRELLRKSQVLHAINYAIDHKTIEVYYQPVIDSATEKIVAAEALARINDPDLGEISPSEFIPLAESSGLIIELGKCVREEVWNFLSNYDILSSGLNHISVNLSSIECVQQSVMDEILEEENNALCEEGTMNFEITETTAVSSQSIIENNMNLLINHGFHFHLDDYGIGYSGMSNLVSLPFYVVKFDKSLLDLSVDKDRINLIKEIIAPLSNLGINIICEGVETADHLQIVRDWGIHYVQGYLFSKPLPEDDFVRFAFIKSRNRL